jgi:diguanylate cyclase (GGDEF)-like protein
MTLRHEGSFVNASNGLLRRADGHDYVLKVSASAMRDAEGNISGAVLVLHDITDTMQMTRELNYLAAHDPLTGLVNRREFERRLGQSIHDKLDPGEGHVLLYMDLDQFKVVNDTCGHRAGDELLKQLAAQLSYSLRESDTLARLGGDEFGVLLKYCPLEMAQQLADKLRQMIKGFRFVWEGKSFVIGVSIGLVPISSNIRGTGELLSAADAACYFAKEQGRNRVYSYHEGDDDTLERHGEMSWVHRITEGFEAERFRLDAQHIAPLHDSNELPHYEILLRMVSEEGHIVPPMAFIPAAERYNLMPTIDRWVIRTTFAMLCHVREQSGRVPIGCSINLSGQSLADDNFLEFIVEQLELSGLEAELICFEITETAAITHLGRAMKLFGELRQRGCRFSLDDFGSGLSSFGYLKTLPVDYLKIDGTFVKDILEDKIDETMVEASHKVGHVMELQTIAEFVENDAIAERLRQIGVNYAQGYGIAHPEPLSEVLKRHSV